MTRQLLAPLDAVRELSTPAAAFDALAAAPPPEIVLLAQPRPGAWQQAELDRLQAAAPLVSIVIVAGTWCEGELRTGRPLAGALRLYWYELAPWWRLTLARRAAGLALHWSRSGDASPTGAPRGELRLVAIDAPDFSVFEALAFALQPFGWQAAWTPQGRGDIAGASAGLWDGGQLDAGELDALRQFCQRFSGSPAPVIALLDFPRTEHFDSIGDCSCASLLGKPYSVSALAAELALISDQALHVARVSSVPLPSTGREHRARATQSRPSAGGANREATGEG